MMATQVLRFNTACRLFFFISLLKCSLVSIAFIVRWLVLFFHTFQFKKRDEFYKSYRERKHLFSQNGSWMFFNMFARNQSSFQLLHNYITDEYLHILLRISIYSYSYLIHIGDGDREIIEAHYGLVDHDPDLDLYQLKLFDESTNSG